MAARNVTGAVLKPTVFNLTAKIAPRMAGKLSVFSALSLIGLPAALPLISPLIVHPLDTLYVREVVQEEDGMKFS